MDSKSQHNSLMRELGVFGATMMGLGSISIAPTTVGTFIILTIVGVRWS